MAIGTAITAALVEGITEIILNGVRKSGVRGFDAWQQSRFAQKLARRLNSIGKAKTLWSQDIELSINTFYYPPRLFIENKTEKPNKISDLPQGPIIIEGIAGQGKSILLRYLAFSELKSNEAQVVPIFIELRSLTKNMGLRQAIVKTLYSYDINADDESLEYIFGCGKFALLLDGFDEVESQLVKDLLSDIDVLATKYSNLRLLITTRPYDEVQKLTSLKKITIEPLKVGDYVEFLKAGGFTAASAMAIRDAIQKSSGEISKLITTPLMLTLVGQLYQNELEIPDNTPDFFERIFRHTFVTHDKLKAGINRKKYTDLGQRKLQELFEAFCFVCMCEGIVATVPSADFGRIFDLAVDHTIDCKCNSEDFLLEITKGACLLLPDGDENIHFLHKSLLDYFSASFIKKADSVFSDNFYAEVSVNPSPWFQVLAFLQYIDPRNFHKKFHLPELAIIIDEVNNFLDSKDESGLIKFIEKHHPESGAIFREEEIDVLISSAFGRFSIPNKFSLQKLNVSLTIAASQTVPDKIRKSQITDIFPMALETHDFGLHLKTRYVISIWGAIKYFEHIGSLMSTLQRARETADRILEIGAKQSSLLDRIKQKRVID